MLAIGLFEPFAKLLAWFYSFTNNYILAISLIALIVMLITAPLVLKSTKGMLEMQKLQPQMRRLQAEHRGDRQKLNEEMMKLYKEHKVNPLASCLPLVLQFPVFIIMYRVLHGLTNTDASKGPGFQPLYLAKDSKLYKSLVGKNEMLSWGLDLAQRPYKVLADSFGKGLIYALLVVALGALYFLQQRMVAARATVAPTMSATQQKLMQYLPVVFAFFLFFYLTGLVVYYMAQAIFRIGLQAYITRKFYHGEHSLGRMAIAAGNEARELSKKDGGGGGMFAQAKRDLTAAKNPPAKGQAAKGVGSGKPASNGASAAASTSKRVTPPKGRPTSGARPASTGRANRPGGATRPPKKK
ncbi:MAG: OxaA family protein [Ilumatobacteraceae bacterium]|jgi:YidC/Oxa1 family membrane protein insertase|nr:OxaA family protein [Ilumatobacteraceae bacterium]